MKYHFPHVFLAVAFSVSTMPAFPGIIRHDVNREHYEELAKQPEFASVARYSTSETSEDYAAGVLIAPTWILTAAHFLEDGSVWFLGDAYYRTKSIIKHPKLSPGASETQWEGWDMALVELDRPVHNIEPAIRYSGRSELGKEVTKVGYGFVGDGTAGMKSPRLSMRLAGRNTIDAIGESLDGRQFSADVMACDFDSPDTQEFNAFGSSIPLALEIGGSKGDSGGGAFVYDEGKWKLVGIVSGGLRKDVEYGSVIALTRVSSANAWIDSVLTQSNRSSR
jgi:secreted trypsin-like serine protease